MFDPHTLLLLAALAAPLDSASMTPSANDSVLASVVAPLIKPGDPLRVRTGFGVIQGHAGWIRPQGLKLRTEAADIWSQPQTTALTWSQIERIDMHTPVAGNAAKIGASVGCLLGLAAVASAWAYSSAYGSGPGAAEGVFVFVAGGVVGGCVGGLAGGLVGSVFPAWKTVYERR